MADIFFSYNSADRERVRPIHDALEAQGFEVFWDQKVPPGVDWDSWIRQNLAKSKCAIVFWSAASVASDNVRHEAVIAKEQGKLVPALLERLTVGQFPMGLYTTQAANLVDWEGDLGHEGWRKLSREVKAKLIPGWVLQEISELEAELVAERTRREGVERRDRALQAQIAKEVEAQQELKRERDEAIDQAEGLKAKIDKLNRARSESEARVSELSQRIREAEAKLSQERDHGVEITATLKAEIERLGRVQSESEMQAAELSLRLREAQTRLQESERQAKGWKEQIARAIQPRKQEGNDDMEMATTFRAKVKDLEHGKLENGTQESEYQQNLDQAEIQVKSSNNENETSYMVNKISYMRNFLSIFIFLCGIFIAFLFSIENNVLLSIISFAISALFSIAVIGKFDKKYLN